MVIRKLEESEKQSAIRLVLRVFMEFEAAEYSTEGIENFKNDLANDKFLNSLSMFGAFDGERLTGVVATRNEGGHISLFFVEREYQRRGIGKKLFEKIIQDCRLDKVTVNSSPYAVEIYKRLGFTVTSVEQNFNGIRFTPMVYIVGQQNK